MAAEPGASGEEAGGKVKGKIKRTIPSKHQILIVDEAGKERTINVEKTTTIRLNEKVKVDPFSGDELLKGDFDPLRREPTMSFRADKEVRGLRAGDQVVVEYQQKNDRTLAALILTERKVID